MAQSGKLHAGDGLWCKETIFWAIYRSHYISCIARTHQSKIVLQTTSNQTGKSEGEGTIV